MRIADDFLCVTTVDLAITFFDSCLVRFQMLRPTERDTLDGRRAYERKEEKVSLDRQSKFQTL